MKIVCDTNVLVSGVLFGGHAREILRLAAQGSVRNFISSEILHEVEEVLDRDKFGLSREQVAGIVQLMRDSFELVEPKEAVSVITADPDDNRILEAAVAAKADFVVSGDQHVLAVRRWRAIEILSPAEFVVRIKTAGGR